MAEHSVAVCVCTRNRPWELAAALSSFTASTVPIEQVVVADDSTDDLTASLVRESFPEVELVDGPRRGLAPNRNAALKAVSTTHVVFLDDDAKLGSDFVAVALDSVARSARPHRTIVTGCERQPTGLVEPRSLTFLGHQARPYREGEPLTTIVINATLFPASLFELIKFDPQLVYGCEEADLAARAVAEGFEIAFRADAVNIHRPSQSGRAHYQPYLEASRLYATWKRYSRTDGNQAKAAAFLAAAAAHTMAYELKRGGVDGLRAASRALRIAFGYITHLRREPRLDRW